MKELDGETMDILIRSLSNIYEIPEKKLINFFVVIPDNLSEEEVYKEIKKITKNQKYDVIYAFHYTRCSEGTKKNIQKNGLINAIEAINFIFEDIYSYFEDSILKNDYNKLVDEIKINYSKLPRNPIEDDFVNGFIFNIFPYFKPHFLIKYEGPELVCDVIKEMRKKHDFFIKYHDYLSPHIVKVKIKISNNAKEEYLKALTYYFYCYLKGNNDYSIYNHTITFSDNKNILYVKKVSEIYE